MLLDFFFTLRRHQLPVSIREHLLLIEAIQAQTIGPDLTEFYHLARTTLVKDESNYDKYDRAFAAYFKGIETLAGVSA